MERNEKLVIAAAVVATTAAHRGARADAAGHRVRGLRRRIDLARGAGADRALLHHRGCFLVGLITT